MVETVPSKGQPRLEHLKKIEVQMIEQFQGVNLYETDAPADYSSLSFEEKNSQKYMATFPYPYMNGYLHLGHAYSMSKAEFMTRYQRQLGKQVLFPFGFHCTGMPISAAARRLQREIEQGKTCSNQPTAAEIKAFKKKDANYAPPSLTQFEILKALDLNEDEIPAFQDPNHWLEFFPPIGKEQLQKFGIHTDWRRSFITTQKNPYYDSFIRWQFHHLKANGKIKFGKRYTIYSELDGQACADHDRSKGEGVGAQEYTGIKIQILEDQVWPESLTQFKGRNVFLVAATLRPETMYGQTNCFVKPDGEYGVFEMANGDLFVISERSARNFAFQEMTKEEKKYPSLATVRGDSLMGLKVKAPLTKYEFVHVLPLPTISMTKGTGVVTSVPSDSPDDWAMLRDLQQKKGLREKLNVEESWVAGFDPIPIIEIPGMGDLSACAACDEFKVTSHKDANPLALAKKKCYDEGFYKGKMIIGLGEGKPVQEVKPLVKEHMIKEGSACQYYEPEKEVVSRTGDNCIVALCDQWLLNYGEDQWRDLVMGHVVSDNFQTYNPKTQKEFELILNWLKEWGCSRTTGLGTLLPWDNQFVIESLSDSTIYMAYYTIAHLLQGGQLDGCSTGPAGIAAESMTIAAYDYIFLGKDFDAEACPNVTEEQLQKLRNEFNYWYPMDLRVSGKDLIRNHLTMSLYNHQAIWQKEEMMTRSYFCNGYLMLNHEKMSKSTGNWITLAQCIDRYGVDASRMALADSGDTLDDANFEEDVANSSVLKLFVLEQWIQSNMPKGEELDWSEHDENKYGEWDQIIINEVRRVANESKEAYASMKFKVVVKLFGELLSLKEAYLIATENKANPFVLSQLIESMLTIINPICPHFAQHCWQSEVRPALLKSKNLPKQPEEYLIKNGWMNYGDKPVDTNLSEVLSYVQEIKSSVRIANEKALTGGKKKGKAKKGAAPEEPKVLENCIVIIGKEYPEFQQQVLGIMQNCADDEDGNISKEYIVKIREQITGKKESGLALKFAAFVAEQAKTVGRQQALQLSMPFEEAEVLEKNKPFIFENMKTIKSIRFMDKNEEELATIDGAKQVSESAVPGKPAIMFF